MILDLGMVPSFSRRVMADDHGIFFDLSPDPADAPPRRNDAPEGDVRQGVAPDSTSGCLPPFAGWAPVVLLSLSLSLLAACGRSEPTPVVAPLPPAGAVPSLAVLPPVAHSSRPAAGDTSRRSGTAAPAPLLAQLDALALRVEALEQRRDLASYCLPGCIGGVQSVKVTRDGIACRCIRPNVGVYRLPERARVAEDRAGALVRVGEPAEVGTDTGRGGLAFAGGT